MACGAGCSSLTRVCFSLVFLSFLVFSVDHHGTFCTHLLLIVPGLLWYVLFLRFCSASGKIGRERLCQTLIATDDADHRDQSSCTSMIGVYITSAVRHSPAVIECTRSLWHVAAYVMAVTVAVILGVLSDRRHVKLVTEPHSSLVLTDTTTADVSSPFTVVSVSMSTFIVTRRRVVHSSSCLLVSTFILS